MGDEKELVARIRQAVNFAALKDKLRDKYPAVKGKADFDAVPVGQTQKLIDIVVATGAKADEVKKFAADNEQLTSTDQVQAFVSARYQAVGGGKRNLTSEQVQRIKDLIAQQGSLDFRIVANEHQDGVPIRGRGLLQEQDTRIDAGVRSTGHARVAAARPAPPRRRRRLAVHV